MAPLGAIPQIPCKLAVKGTIQYRQGAIIWHIAPGGATNGSQTWARLIMEQRLLIRSQNGSFRSICEYHTLVLGRIQPIAIPIFHNHAEQVCVKHFQMSWDTKGKRAKYSLLGDVLHNYTDLMWKYSGYMHCTLQVLAYLSGHSLAKWDGNEYSKQGMRQYLKAVLWLILSCKQNPEVVQPPAIRSSFLFAWHRLLQTSFVLTSFMPIVVRALLSVRAYRPSHTI